MNEVELNTTTWINLADIIRFKKGQKQKKKKVYLYKVQNQY